MTDIIIKIQKNCQKITQVDFNCQSLSQYNHQRITSPSLSYLCLRYAVTGGWGRHWNLCRR